MSLVVKVIAIVISWCINGFLCRLIIYGATHDHRVSCMYTYQYVMTSTSISVNVISPFLIVMVTAAGMT